MRVHEVTALICRQSHTSMGFANSFTLPFPTPCEIAGANSLHYATASLLSKRTLWTMRMRSSQPRKNLFLVFSRARNHLKIRPQVIDSKPLDWVLRILRNIYRFSWESRYWAARTYDEIRSPFSTLSCLLAWFLFLILFSPKQRWPNRQHGSQIAGPQPIRAAVFLLDHESSCSRERSSPGAKKI